MQANQDIHARQIGFEFTEERPQDGHHKKGDTKRKSVATGKGKEKAKVKNDSGFVLTILGSEGEDNPDSPPLPQLRKRKKFWVAPTLSSDYVSVSVDLPCSVEDLKVALLKELADHYRHPKALESPWRFRLAKATSKTHEAPHIFNAYDQLTEGAEEFVYYLAECK